MTLVFNGLARQASTLKVSVQIRYVTPLLGNIMKTREKLVGPWPMSVTKADLRIEYYRGSGPGGQHRNKRDTACRITHIPTGLSATAQENKSQQQNREAAFRRLADKLIPIMKRELSVRPKIEPVLDKEIRVYKEKHDRVVDNRLDQKFSYKKVLEGDLEEIHN